MNIKLDKKDYRILYELDLDARQPYARIAQKAALSKQTVINRIRRLEQLGIIQKYLAIIDLGRLGYEGYKVFLRLQNADAKKRQEIIGYLQNQPPIQWLALTDGQFDLNFNIFVKNAEELNGCLRQLSNRYGIYISERQLIILLIGKFYVREYLIGKKTGEVKKPMHFGRKSEGPPYMDRIDQGVLSWLGKDARTSILDISHRLGVSPDTVRQRIKKLEKKGIIHNYAIVLNNQQLNQLHYKVLFRLENVTASRETALEEYFRVHPRIWFSSRAIGPWDEEVNIEVRNTDEFRKVMEELKEKFSDVIRDYSVLGIYSVEKFNFYPFKLGETV